MDDHAAAQAWRVELLSVMRAKTFIGVCGPAFQHIGKLQQHFSFIIPAKRFAALPTYGLALALSGFIYIGNAFYQASHDRELQTITADFKLEAANLRRQAGIE